MRALPIFLLSVLVACVGQSNHDRRASTTPQYVRLGAESPHVVFDAAGWHQEVDVTMPDQAILHHADHDGLGLAIWINEADPGSTVEATNERFAMMLLTAPILFKVVEVTPPERLSDEEAGFVIRGDEWRKGTKMVALCKVKIVSGHGVAYWAMMIVYGPEERISAMQVEMYRLAQSLQIEAPQTPK